jgi:hypothetical protein
VDFILLCTCVNGGDIFWTNSNVFDAKDDNSQDDLIDTNILNEAIVTEFTSGAIVLLSGSLLFPVIEF